MASAAWKRRAERLRGPDHHAFVLDIVLVIALRGVVFHDLVGGEEDRCTRRGCETMGAAQIEYVFKKSRGEEPARIHHVTVDLERRQALRHEDHVDMMVCGISKEEHSGTMRNMLKLVCGTQAYSAD